MTLGRYLLSAALFLACLNTAVHGTEAQVSAGGEILQGVIESNGVLSFRGIPYAAPPLGELRWRAPQPTTPRTGVQDATTFAAGCYQDDYNTQWYRDVGEAFGEPRRNFQDPPFSEDCLYLNVWTPAVDQGKRPVMVWIHGGSNKAGWSFEVNYQGQYLADHGDVVVVSVGYRLGVFSVFSLPEMRAQLAPSNYGLLDQIAALQWVQDYIHIFGGDPKNVTVFGESAGAASVGYLLMSPLATGLFQRGISQSGGFQLMSNEPLSTAEATGTAVAKQLGAENLADMKRKSAEHVFVAARDALPNHYYAPVVDGYSMTQSPAEFLNYQLPTIDLLLGSNDNELHMYLDNSQDAFEQTLLSWPTSIRPFMRERADQEATVQAGHDVVSTLVDMVCANYHLANHAVQAGKRAWVYRFTRVRPGPGGEALLSYHGAEIPYVFNTHDEWLTGNVVEKRLSNQMMSYWANFARTGDPNDSQLPAWPPFNDKQPQVMELGDQSQAMAAPDYGLCEKIYPTLLPTNMTGIHNNHNSGS
ncbi:MAG: carboxylesterase family protein [Pseudomonadota bacterium]